MSPLPPKAVARVRRLETDESARQGTAWQTVRDRILARIRSQEWAPGSLIPTEKQLAAEWRCARATVNRALRDLADAGIVERRRKVGTRVSATPSMQGSRETSTIRNEIRATGAEVGYRLLQAEQRRATAEIARELHVNEGDPVHYVSAVFLADGAPYCGQSVWLNSAALRGLSGANLAENSPEEWLENTARPNRSRVAILSQPIDRNCAEAMQVTPGTALLTIERTDWLDTVAVAFTRQVFPPRHRLVYDD